MIEMSTALPFLFKFWLTLTVIILCYILPKFLFIPLYKMHPYKKQGIPCYFSFIVGLMKRFIIGEYKHNDFMHYYKTLAKKDPNLQLEVANVGGHLTVLLLDPKMIKQFYANQGVYSKINPSKAVAALMGNGLVLAENEVWKHHRKVISSVFHFEFLKDNIGDTLETTRDLLNKLRTQELKKVNIMDEIQKITGEVVGRIFFGENLNKYTIKGQPLTLHLAELTHRCSLVFRSLTTMFLFLTGLDLELSGTYRKLMKDIREFRQFCFKIVEDRKMSKVKADDLLGLLLETQTRSDSEDMFSDEDIVNEFVTFVIAGMDTTGHMITMALYLVNENPQYINKLEEEIERVYNKNDKITLETLNKMDLMHAIFKETLRFYLPVPGVFPRMALEDHEINGVKIKKWMSVGVNPLYSYFNSKYFDKPEEFRPERWLGKKDRDLDPYVYTPFSAGARNCIGQHLAIIKSKIIVAEFMKMFRFKVVPKDYKLVMTLSFLYEPRENLYMDLALKE